MGPEIVAPAFLRQSGMRQDGKRVYAAYFQDVRVVRHEIDRHPTRGRTIAIQSGSRISEGNVPALELTSNVNASTMIILALGHKFQPRTKHETSIFVISNSAVRISNEPWWRVLTPVIDTGVLPAQ